MRFLRIRDKIRQVGFDEFCQAGSTSIFHPMNIVCRSQALNLQFWVGAEGGYGVSETYHISTRPLNDCNAPGERMEYRSQSELIAGLEEIHLKIVAAIRLNAMTEEKLIASEEG